MEADFVVLCRANTKLISLRNIQSASIWRWTNDMVREKAGDQEVVAGVVFCVSYTVGSIDIVLHIFY